MALQSFRSGRRGAKKELVQPYNAAEKRERIERYRSKRCRRNFQKRILYAARKVNADNRVRINGRFAPRGYQPPAAAAGDVDGDRRQAAAGDDDGDRRPQLKKEEGEEGGNGWLPTRNQTLDKVREAEIITRILSDDDWHWGMLL